MTPSTPKTLPELPEPDTTWYGSFSSDRVKFHSTDQIYEFAAARVKAALAAQPPAGPLYQYTDGTLSTEREVLDAVGVYARARPEDGESWESWYEAAFDMTGERVRAVFRECKQRAEAPPAVAAIPEGMALVPKKATREMLNAAIDVDAFKLGDISPLGFRMSPQQLFEKCYEAMLSKVAQPPAGQQDRGEAKPYGLDDFFAEARAKNLTVHDILPRLKERLAEIEDAPAGEATAAQGAKPGELLEAARLFHNLTQGDPEVIIRPPSAAKRDAITAAGERLRAAISTAKLAEAFIGESAGADFSADEWTFKMKPGYSVGAGYYRIEFIGLGIPSPAAPGNGEGGK